MSPSFNVSFITAIDTYATCFIKRKTGQIAQEHEIVTQLQFLFIEIDRILLIAFNFLIFQND